MEAPTLTFNQSLLHTVPVASSDGSRCELLCIEPVSPWSLALHWLPAMGVSARQYRPLAQALAECGIAVAVQEWRGIGSSNRRAGRRANWGYRELLGDDLPAAQSALHQHWSQASWLLGGHSLGGQLAMLHAAMARENYAGIALVASGSPCWRSFRYGAAIGAAYALAPMLAQLFGYLPGRRIGFGGNEARGVIADWARSGRTGTYAARGLPVDLEAALRKLRTPVLGVRLADDWLAPAASLDHLLDKSPLALRTDCVITAAELAPASATHFTWMAKPQLVAASIVSWAQKMAGSASPTQPWENCRMRPCVLSEGVRHDRIV